MPRGEAPRVGYMGPPPDEVNTSIAGGYDDWKMVRQGSRAGDVRDQGARNLAGRDKPGHARGVEAGKGQELVIPRPGAQIDQAHGFGRRDRGRVLAGKGVDQ